MACVLGAFCRRCPVAVVGSGMTVYPKRKGPPPSWERFYDVSRRIEPRPRGTIDPGNGDRPIFADFIAKIRTGPAQPFTGTVPIFAAKSAKTGLPPWPMRDQAHSSARNGPKNEPLSRL